jgi:hypothetical protein
MNDKAKSTSGWIYMLGNESMPDLCKIGQTQRTPEERAMELSGGTGVPSLFHVIHSCEVSNVHEAEKEAHKILSAYRINNNREFFKIEIKLAVEIFELVAKRFLLKDTSNEIKSSIVITKSPPQKTKSRKQRNLEDIRKKNRERLDRSKPVPPLTHAQVTKLRTEKKAKKGKN